VTYRLTVRGQAKTDIREAAHWHERQRRGLGHPAQISLRPFYRIDGPVVLMLAVVHLHRDPSTWQDREPGREG
jgi:hypothetical protein